MKVIFGAGQLGLAIADQLGDSGEPTLLVSRSGKQNYIIPANAILVKGDVSDPKQVNMLTKGASVVFICLDAPYTEWYNFYPSVIRGIIDGLTGTGINVVYADNLYAYGDLQGRVVSEALPYRATTRKGIVRQEVASWLMAAHTAGKLNVAIGRASDFIGPRIYKGIFGTDFLQGLFNGTPVDLMGNPALAHTFTYIEDFAKSLVLLAQNSKSFGQEWLVPNAPAISQHEWLILFENGSGKKAKVRTVGKFSLRIVGIFNAFVRELSELSYQFENPYLVNHQKFSDEFGNQFTSPEQVVKQTLEWFQIAHPGKKQ